MEPWNFITVHSVGNFIIPTVTHSIIFQRGRWLKHQDFFWDLIGFTGVLGLKNWEIYRISRLFQCRLNGMQRDLLEFNYQENGVSNYQMVANMARSLNREKIGIHLFNREEEHFLIRFKHMRNMVAVRNQLKVVLVLVVRGVRGVFL